jgi:hypothetical protein|tara:strand:- start:105 stop:503 length:399 start_codon:yes stop_codon:yes gene_type:complete
MNNDNIGDSENKMNENNMVLKENENNIQIGNYNIDLSNIFSLDKKNKGASNQSGGSLTQLTLPVGLLLLNNLYPSNDTIEDIYKKEYETEDNSVIPDTLYDKLFGLLSASNKKTYTRKINKKNKKNKTRKST